MITKKEVKHIAKLARLGLSEKEIGKFQGELSKILDYIGKLKEVDSKKITPTSYSIEMENVMMGDEEKEKLKTKKDATLKLLELAPETKNSYLKVKSSF